MNLIEPTKLARHYTEFLVHQRVLLTGHSHQAWPNVAREGLIQAWHDAASGVSSKWANAFVQADRVRQGYRRWLSDQDAESVYALASSGHDLCIRLFSALPSRELIVSTRAEFHSATRQLRRATEAGFQIYWVDEDPIESLVSRVADRVDNQTSLVLISSVTYRRGLVLRDIPLLAERCRLYGVPLLVDAYHQVGALPFDIGSMNDAFVLGGGNKYCQMGEGVAFLRVPAWAQDLRPIVTGWFADAPDHDGRIGYADGAARWEGATYDVTAHYRAARVLDFFDEHQLSAERLRRLSIRQVERLRDGIRRADLDPRRIRERDLVPAEQRGGFLALQCDDADAWVAALRQRGVWADARGGILRLGPALYVTDEQLDQAVQAITEVGRARG